MSTETDLAEAAANLNDYRRRADRRLAEILDAAARAREGLPFGASRYLALLADYALRGGKRLRGALVMLGFEAAKPLSDPRAFEASLAFELLHAFLLAFDDWMDRDDLRRGGPALHVAAAREADGRGSADAAHRGASVATLLGLVAEAQAFHCLERAGASREARAYFDHVTEEVVVGQLLDVVAVDAREASLEDVAVIHRLKTGVYTTEGPLVFGALLAGESLDGALVRQLRAYAAPLGEAFQLVDDLLGVVGDAKETGKPASGDLREGKRSALLEEALARLEGDRKERLRALVGRPLDADEAAEAKALVVQSGAVEAVRNRARALASRAREALGPPVDVGAAAKLASLASLVVERQN